MLAVITAAAAGFVVGASFTVIDETRAWCDSEGVPVSFTNLRLSQTRNGPAVAPGTKPKGTAACDSYMRGVAFDGF